MEEGDHRGNTEGATEGTPGGRGCGHVTVLANTLYVSEQCDLFFLSKSLARAQFTQSTEELTLVQRQPLLVPDTRGPSIGSVDSWEIHHFLKPRLGPALGIVGLPMRQNKRQKKKEEERKKENLRSRDANDSEGQGGETPLHLLGGLAGPPRSHLQVLHW